MDIGKHVYKMEKYLEHPNDHRGIILGTLTINDQGLSLGRLRVNTAEPQANNSNDENLSSDEEG